MLSQGGLRDIKEGIWDGLALIPLYLPLAGTFAVMAIINGLSPFETILWSAMVFAGMSQIASLNVLMLGGGFFEVLVITFLVNLRHGIVALSVAPFVRNISQKFLLPFAFSIVTPSVGLIPAKAKRGGSVKIYGLSTQFCQYSQWVGFTILGVYLGVLMPSTWQSVISFAAPATFIGLVILLLEDSSKIGCIVVLVAGLMTLMLSLFITPNLAVIISAIVSALAGLLKKD